MVQEGLIVAPPASGLALGASGYDGEGWPRVVQRVDLVRIREQLKRPLLPFVLRLSPASDHGYERDWRVRTGLTPAGASPGLCRAVVRLAVALVGLCVWVAVKRVQEEYRGP